jgi:hypothetical protein
MNFYLRCTKLVASATDPKKPCRAVYITDGISLIFGVVRPPASRDGLPAPTLSQRVCLGNPDAVKVLALPLLLHLTNASSSLASLFPPPSLPPTNSPPEISEIKGAQSSVSRFALLNGCLLFQDYIRTP